MGNNTKIDITSSLAAVVIGRNEGARLIAGLKRLGPLVDRIVYVDSGSSDGSVAAALDQGAEVVELDLGTPFTAARARNAGLRHLSDNPPEFVQFMDGDCLLDPDWLHHATLAMIENPNWGAVAGRRREIAPERTLYNRLCDAEWDTPVGPARAIGGDALLRHQALSGIGGYRDSLIAGEEPEMCVRLRAAGWEVHRLPHEMTLHDADMTRFGQWWNRTRRAGFAFAEGAALHGKLPERHWVAETRRAVLWGAVLPVAAIVLALAIHPVFLLLFVAYPAQILRLSRRMDPIRAVFTVLGKFPEALGALEFHIGKVLRRRTGLIEYK
ncbi:glycosyltransferase [Paracoccus sp. PARArs4]|uniref:glycosyltransferase family 2 protein n=1 Tax=Paracoccus sp. PARArs4 TaxID=2853442 RepID=UPI0024A73104|nr:glycosyltransferase [Paracoccus sp. PARArs4]